MDHKKELLLIGGRPQFGGDIYKYMAEIARPEGEIGYISFASTDEAMLAEKKPLLEAEFAQYGIKVRFIESEDDCYGLGIIYMGGGSQIKLRDELKSTGIDELIRPAWKYGDVVLAGSSAGAMVLFWEMLLDPEFDPERVDLTDGIGPMAGGIVMPHWDITKQHVKDNLIATHSDKLIIGIDENTALRWRRGRCDVLGTGKVTLMGRSEGVYGSGETFELS
jgi:cyanophycinase